MSEAIEVYDFFFSESQIKKCAKIIAEVVVQLFDEKKITLKKFYYHQDQVPIRNKIHNIGKLGYKLFTNSSS